MSVRKVSEFEIIGEYFRKTVQRKTATQSANYMRRYTSQYSNGISPSILDRKIKGIEAFQSRPEATSIGFSTLIGIIYVIIYSIVSFFWLCFHSPIQYGDNEIHIVIAIDSHYLMRYWTMEHATWLTGLIRLRDYYLS